MPKPYTYSTTLCGKLFSEEQPGILILEYDAKWNEEQIILNITWQELENLGFKNQLRCIVVWSRKAPLHVTS
jgi:hypothetical protein